MEGQSGFVDVGGTVDADRSATTTESKFDLAKEEQVFNLVVTNSHTCPDAPKFNVKTTKSPGRNVTEVVGCIWVARSGQHQVADATSPIPRLRSALVSNARPYDEGSVDDCERRGAQGEDLQELFIYRFRAGVLHGRPGDDCSGAADAGRYSFRTRHGVELISGDVASPRESVHSPRTWISIQQRAALFGNKLRALDFELRVGNDTQSACSRPRSRVKCVL